MLCIKTNHSMLRFIFFILLLVNNNFDHSGISLSSASPQIYTYTGISPLTQRLDRRYAENYDEKHGYGYQGDKYDDRIVNNNKYKTIDNQLSQQYNFGQRRYQYELNEGDKGIKNIPFSGYTISDGSTGLRQYDSMGYLSGSENSGAKQFGSSGYLSGSGNSGVKQFDSLRYMPGIGSTRGYITGIGNTGGRQFDSSRYLTGIGGGKQRRHSNTERYITGTSGTGIRNIDSTGYINSGNYGSTGQQNSDSFGDLTSNLYNKHSGNVLSSSNFDTSTKNIIGIDLPRNLIRKCIITNNLNDCNYFIDIGSTFQNDNNNQKNSLTTGNNQQQIRKCAITDKLEDCNEFILITFTTKQDENIFSSTTTTNNYNGIIDGNRIRKCIITGNLQDCGIFVTILNYSKRNGITNIGRDIVTTQNNLNLIRKCLITNKQEDCDEFIEIPKNQIKSVQEIEDNTNTGNRKRFQTIRKCAITEKLHDCNKFIVITYNSLLGETDKIKSKQQAGHHYIKKCVITNKLNDCDKFIEINYNFGEETNNNNNQQDLLVMQPPIKYQLSKCIITNKIDDCGKSIEITLNDQSVLNSYGINSLASFNTDNIKETKIRKCLLTNQIDDCNEFISYPYQQQQQQQQQQNDKSNFQVISNSNNYHQEGIQGGTHQIRLCAITNNVEDCNRFINIEYNPLKDQQYIDKNHLFKQMEPLPNIIDTGGFLNHNKEKLEQPLLENYRDQAFPIDNNNIQSSYEQFPNRREEINVERRDYGQRNDFYSPNPHHHHHHHHQYQNQPEYQQYEGVMPDNSKRYHTQHSETSYHNEKFQDGQDFRKYPNRYYRDEPVENVPRDMDNPSKSVLQNKEVQKWSTNIGIPLHQNHGQYYNEEHHRHYHKQNQGDTTGREEIYSTNNFEQRQNYEPNRFVSSEKKTDYPQQIQYGEIPERQKEINIYRDQQQPPSTYSSENPPDYNQQFENSNKLNLNENSIKNQPFRGQFKETIRNPIHEQNSKNNKPEYYDNNKYITGNEGKNFKYYTNYYGHERNLPVGAGSSKEELQVSVEKESRYEQRYGEARLPQNNNFVQSQITEVQRQPENFHHENDYNQYKHRYADNAGQQGGLPIGSGKLPEGTVTANYEERRYEQRYGETQLPQNNNNVQSQTKETQRQPENFRPANNYKRYEHRYTDNAGQQGGLPVGSGKLPEGTAATKYEERRYEQRYMETQLPQNNNNVQSQTTQTQRQPENFRPENNYKRYEHRYTDNAGQQGGLPVGSGKLPEGTAATKYEERRYEQRYVETQLPKNNNNVQNQTNIDQIPENTIELPFKRENAYILGNDKKAITSGKRIFLQGISDYYSEMRYNIFDEPEIYMCRNRNGVKECHKFVSSVKLQELNRSKLTCNCKDGLKCKCDNNMNAFAGKDVSFSCRCNDITKTFQGYGGFQCQCIRDLNSDNALICQCNNGTGNNDKLIRSLTCQNSSNTKLEQSASHLGIAVTSNPIVKLETERSATISQLYISSLGLGVTSNPSKIGQTITNDQHFTTKLGLTVTSNPIDSSEVGRTESNGQIYTSTSELAATKNPISSSEVGRTERNAKETNSPLYTTSLGIAEKSNPIRNSETERTITNNQPNTSHLTPAVTRHPNHSSKEGRNVTIYQIHTPNLRLTGTGNNKISSKVGATVSNNRSNMTVTSKPFHNSREGRHVTINQSHTSHSGLTATGNNINSRAGRTNTIKNNQTDVLNFGLTVTSNPIGNSQSERIVTNKQIYISHLNGSVTNNPFASSAWGNQIYTSHSGNEVSSSNGGQKVKNNHLYTSYYNPTGGSGAGQTITNRHTINLGLAGTGNSGSERTVYGKRNGSSKFGITVSGYQTGASNFDQYGMGQKSFERNNYQIVNQTHTTYGRNKIIKYRFSCNCHKTTIGLHCNCNPTGMKHLANNTATCWCSNLAANDRGPKCNCADDVTVLGFVAKLPQKGTWCQCNKAFDINATGSLICPCPYNPKYNATVALSSFLRDTKSNLIASNVINLWNSSDYGRSYGNLTSTYNITRIYKPYRIITYYNTTVLPPNVITIKKPSKIVTTIKRTETYYQTNNKMANFSKDAK